jgi:energy-converting hydrogenase A subunit R
MICFDLEGPLSPQDNAYEVMDLSESGGKVFEALSEYDDILALKERPGYEPGDTLKLIVPFLKYYGIVEDGIKEVSEGAVLVQGMKEVVSWLKGAGQQVRIISTSYEQHAHIVGRRLGVSEEEIASTHLWLEDISFDSDVVKRLEKIEKKIIAGGLSDEVAGMLDELYFKSGLFERIGVEVVGGQRKVDVLLKFAREAGEDVSGVVAIGDSITDYKMLREVSSRGGLAVAFNANQYCLPYANVAIATLDGRAILPVIEEFIHGGTQGALEKVEELEEDITRLEDGFGHLLENSPRPFYSLIKKSQGLDEVLRIHKDMRMRVRGEAGKLG